MIAKKGTRSLSLGDRGEMIGWGYLVRHGYKILEKNYRCPAGEIDVVATKGGRIIFIEIKTRAQERFGLPQEAVHASKQQKIIRTAQWYLKEKRMREKPLSFHVMAILFKNGSEPVIQLIENAFILSEERGRTFS